MQETHQNDQNVHGFQVRTPICHIVPVSRAYPAPPPPLTSLKDSYGFAEALAIYITSFRKSYGAPDPQSPKPTPAIKKEIPKTIKSSRVP